MESVSIWHSDRQQKGGTFLTVSNSWNLWCHPLLSNTASMCRTVYIAHRTELNNIKTSKWTLRIKMCTEPNRKFSFWNWAKLTSSHKLKLIPWGLAAKTTGKLFCVCCFYSTEPRNWLGVMSRKLSIIKWDQILLTHSPADKYTTT